MNKYFSILFFLTIILNSCSTGQNNNNLSVTAFADKLKSTSDATILDVRTPSEFEAGHLENAINYDWNSSGFDQQIAGLDKTKPVFVYCLSGGRSASAANRMRKSGFKEVYEMDGGMMKWRAAKLPESTNKRTLKAGMTKQQYDDMLKTDKIVLVDFYADWCAPCKKMKPYLDEISTELANTVLVVRINADENQTLCQELKVDALPVLHVYKKGKLTWNNTGFIEKDDVVKQLQ